MQMINALVKTQNAICNFGLTSKI